MPTVCRIRTIPSVVMLSLPHRLTAWLCLALMLLTGLTPAQRFVVCIEKDGCVSIEVKAADAKCRGCERHAESDTRVQSAATSSDGAPCRCSDLALRASPEQRLAQSRSAEVVVGPRIAPAPEIRVPHATPTITAGRGPHPWIPRAADSLAHLRTVVLLV